jgi:integrase
VIADSPHACGVALPLAIDTSIWPRHRYDLLRRVLPLRHSRALLSQFPNLPAGTKSQADHLRRSHATLALSVNTNPKIISERLEHSNISITMDLYADALQSMQLAMEAKLLAAASGQEAARE